MSYRDTKEYWQEMKECRDQTEAKLKQAIDDWSEDKLNQNKGDVLGFILETYQELLNVPENNTPPLEWKN